MSYLQKLSLWCYRLATISGLFEGGVGRRLFLHVYLLYKRFVEAEDPYWLRQFIGFGTAVFDVGANVGFYTIPFSEWVGDGGVVHAIEPEPRNISALARRVAAVGAAGRVVLHEAVASDGTGDRFLQINEDHPGDHRIADHGFPVKSLSIDAICSAEDSVPVSLIKIDVQGAESLVLSGAIITLRRWRPVVAIELDDVNLQKYGSSAEKVARLLFDEGYTAVEWGTGRGLDLAEIRRRSSDGKYFDCVFKAT